ncbi:hypothetical protein NSPZN2_180014 [Nitrospira defluvii]|uniref:Transposase n=1 Tax=Nitrospira defluvii TaxID=330214 RepID=A0ABM8RCH4_9BACT|nr:hypothetical protein NSPZN2_180014 [Nitrospira defluvii]
MQAECRSVSVHECHGSFVLPPQIVSRPVTAGSHHVARGVRSKYRITFAG